MKPLPRPLLSLVLAAAILCTPFGATAYSGKVFDCLPLTELAGFTTQIVDKEGNLHHFSGVLDIAAFRQTPVSHLVASYTICGPNGKELLSVELCSIPSGTHTLLLGSADAGANAGGYYATEFLLSAEENTYAYLTGLSQSKLETIQEEILEKALTGNDFSIEDIDFIDTEKTTAPDDDALCWAASAANMLHYTGWGTQADSEAFPDEDALFEYFIESFANDGGNQLLGLEWFFSGIYRGNVACKNPDNGRFFPDFDPRMVAKFLSIENNTFGMVQAMDTLRKGYGVGAGIEWGLGTNSGHAVTVWGYLFDRDIHVSAPAHYLALLISDSDSDQGTDRGASPDVIHSHSIAPYPDSSDFITWFFPRYTSGGINGFLNSFTLLEPYNDNLPKETSLDATKDPATTADLSATELILSTTENFAESSTPYFLTSEEVWLNPSFYNLGFATFQGAFTLSLSIADHTGTVVSTKALGDNNANIPPSYGATPPVSFGTLPAGSYTATATIETSVSEAYRYNNSLSVDFQVIDANEPCLVRYDSVRQVLQTYLPEGCAEDAKLLIASYDANGTLSFGKSDSLETGKQNVLIFSPQGDTNQALLWDFANLKPLCSSLSLE